MAPSWLQFTSRYGNRLIVALVKRPYSRACADIPAHAQDPDTQRRTIKRLHVFAEIAAFKTAPPPLQMAEYAMKAVDVRLKNMNKNAAYWEL